jgi:hypothetical protein
MALSGIAVFFSAEPFVAKNKEREGGCGITSRAKRGAEKTHTHIHTRTRAAAGCNWVRSESLI